MQQKKKKNTRRRIIILYFITRVAHCKNYKITYILYIHKKINKIYIELNSIMFTYNKYNLFYEVILEQNQYLR